ncbi:MAG: hypothetical protein ACOCXA_08920, partial [Planctomycetota bacterium]
YKVSKAVSVLASLDSAATIAASRNSLEAPFFTRYLVIDHTTATPIGYISAATLATADGRSTVGEFAQPLPVLDRRTGLAIALQRMHQQGSDLALLTDENGQATGVLFRNDCLRVLVRLE